MSKTKTILDFFKAGNPTLPRKSSENPRTGDDLSPKNSSISGEVSSDDLEIQPLIELLENSRDACDKQHESSVETYGAVNLTCPIGPSDISQTVEEGAVVPKLEVYPGTVSGSGAN